MEHENLQVTGDVFANIEKDLRYISGIIKQKGREMLSNYKITPPPIRGLAMAF